MTSYYSINSKISRETSPVCREKLGDKLVVGYLDKNKTDSNEHDDTVHKVCVEPWLEIHRAGNTPIKRSLKEKVIKELKIVGKDMIVGCCAGALIGEGLEIAKQEKVILCAFIVLEVFTRKVLGMKPQVAITIIGATLLASLFIESASLVPFAAASGAMVSAYYSR